MESRSRNIGTEIFAWIEIRNIGSLRIQEDRFLKRIK